MDFFLFSAINAWAGRFALLDGVGIFFARTAIFLIPGLAFFDAKMALPLLARMVLASALAFATNSVIALLYFRPRPFLSLPDVHQLISLHFLNSKSFPSDHTAISFAMAMMVAFAYPKLGVAAFLVAFLIGVSRIFVGVHYPLDIFGGIVVGILAGCAAQFFASRFFGI